MTSKKWALLGGAIALALVLWLVLWPEGGEEGVEKHEAQAETHREGFVAITPEQLQSSEIAVAEVGLGSAVELVFPATVAARPTGSAVIDARASGVVRSVSKTLGDYVRQGESVARIESAEAANLASQLATARARATEMSAAYEREERLFEANVTARQDLEAAAANLAVARSELQRAEAAIAAAGVSGDGRSLAVTSPISGRITQAPVVLGSFVSAGDELYHVINPSALQVEVAVPAADLEQISSGDEATLLLPGGREIGGRVRSLTPAVGAESRTATAVVSVSGNIPGLQPGAFLEARIRPAGEIDVNRISVPEEAVQVVDGNDVVFRRVEGGFQVQQVSIGERSGSRVTILSGLEAGTPIATDNAFLLKAELEKEGASHAH